MYLDKKRKVCHDPVNEIRQQNDLDIFRVYQSYHIERMVSNINKKIFNVINFLQVLLGSAVMAEVNHTFIVGLLFAILPSWMFIYKPGEKAVQAKEQARRYENLIKKSRSLDSVEINAALVEFGLLDSIRYGFLDRPAYIRAMSGTNRNSDDISREKSKMTRLEAFFNFIS